MQEHQNGNEAYWLTDAPVSKAIFHMVIPMILGMTVNLIYNLTDAFFIGRLNDTAAMAAISFALPYTTVQMALGNLFGVGSGTYISRQMGKKDIGSARKASATVFFLAILTGVACFVLSYLFKAPLLRLLGTNRNTAGITYSYLLPYMIGSPVMIANFMFEELVRSEGASTRAMTGSIISVVTNIVLDPVFIFAFGMGIQGAAIATVIGNACAFGYYLWYIRARSGVLSISPAEASSDVKMLAEILKIGFSALLLDVFLIISGLMFNRYSAHYGDHVVAGFSISQRLVMIADMIGMGIYMGVVPLIAASYASGDRARLRELLRKTAVLLFGVVLAIGCVVFALRVPLVALFTRDGMVAMAAAYILIVQLASTLFAAGSGLFTGIFQAFGKGIPSMVMSAARGVLLIPIIAILNRLYALNGVIISLLVSEACAFFIGLCMYVFSARTERPAREP